MTLTTAENCLLEETGIASLLAWLSGDVATQESGVALEVNNRVDFLVCYGSLVATTPRSDSFQPSGAWGPVLSLGL